MSRVKTTFRYPIQDYKLSSQNGAEFINSRRFSIIGE